MDSVDLAARRRPLIIAHRGASADAPENSLDAFAKAIDVGSDMIEFDVRCTRDGQLILFHDAHVAGVPVRELTRSEIAKRSTSEPPLLDDVLELTSGRIGLDVELKEDGYVVRVLESIMNHFQPADVIVTSFLDEVVSQVKRATPDIRAGLLLGRARPDGYVRTRLSELLPTTRARECGADYIAPHVTLARLGALRGAAAAHLPALVWTVNDAPSIKRLLRDPRVAAIITDVPARALALRDQHG